MGDAHMAEIVCGEYELVPHETEGNSTRDEPAVEIGVGGDGSKEEIAGKLWAVAGEVGGVVETCVCDALVQLAISLSMLGLCVKREGGWGRGEGIESGGRLAVPEGIFSEPLVVRGVVDPARDDGG